MTMKITTKGLFNKSKKRSQILLPAPWVVQAVNGRISFADQEAGLTMILPYYAGRVEGDVIFAICAGRMIRIIADGTTNDIELPLPPGATLPAMGGHGQFLYLVVGDENLDSEQIFYFLEERYPMPTVDEVVDDRITAEIAQSGVTIRIPASPYTAVGDDVSIYAVTTAERSTYVTSFTLEDADIGKDLAVHLDSAHIHPNYYGPVMVFYSLRTSLSEVLSVPYRFNVVAELKIAPDFGIYQEGWEDVNQIKREYIDSDLGLVAPITLAPYPDLQPGSWITWILVSARRYDGYIQREEVTEEMVGQPLKFLIPQRVMESNSGLYFDILALIETPDGKHFGTTIRRWQLLG